MLLATACAADARALPTCAARRARWDTRTMGCCTIAPRRTCPARDGPRAARERERDPGLHRQGHASNGTRAPWAAATSRRLLQRSVSLWDTRAMGHARDGKERDLGLHGQRDTRAMGHVNPTPCTLSRKHTRATGHARDETRVVCGGLESGDVGAAQGAGTRPQTRGALDARAHTHTHTHRHTHTHTHTHSHTLTSNQAIVDDRRTCSSEGDAVFTSTPTVLTHTDTTCPPPFPRRREAARW